MNTESTEPSPFICGLDASLRIIGGKWKPLILFFLGHGPKRYGELKREVRGVSHKMLIQQLKELEAHGVVLRTDYKEVPPRVDYTLTPFGESLIEAMVPLCGWGERNSEVIEKVISKRKEGASS
ncbi:winged helix-turn-helix transcriptional regulator [Sneathiella sp. HT1-7]|uniref:winged helix-turn-helix transcriptional regulator n=1 Tax=Sneathiella sp. HT1-7 TaxID=2887192 RepID=UPI001D13B245|nr:helix-turn-helix domain-containing protein [Sneathiella sp. HT1-7]MCC3303531.1 helix-turn-helix transcriptional regulator [Sneathiella sp. HT1-7]